MKKKTKNPVQTGTGLVCLRTAATLVLLCTFVLITLRTDATYYRNTVKGPRNTVSGPRTVDRSKIQPAGDPHVVGELGRDNEGNVIVRWPPWTNGGNIFWEETLKLGQYKNEADFLKVYLEKCEARGKEPNDRRVLGAEYERKRMYNGEGKKMWSEHLEVLRAARAKEKKEQ